MNLKEAKVLITGGSSGIGFETARQLIAAGAKVVISGRNREKLMQAAAQLGATGIAADAANEDDTIRLVAETIEKLGSFNVLINNAAYGYFESLVDMDTRKFADLFAVNVTGAMIAARESARHFIKQNYGNIINLSSTAGRSGFSQGSAYSASKFAISSMTECWRAELRKFNIRVMQVNPSEVQTEFVTNSGREQKNHNPSKLEAADIAHVILSMLQLHDRGFVTEATVFATNPRD